MKQKKQGFIMSLYQSRETVFSASEISILTGETNPNNLKAKIHYHVSQGVLRRVAQGMYVKPKYDVFELGVKLYKPSYVSLQTVLQKEGVIFQDYQTISLMSYLSREVAVDAHKFSYHKIKNESLVDTTGVLREGNYWIASPERAMLDAMYLFGDYHFDNLGGVDWEKIFEIVKIYDTKKLIKRVEKLYKEEHNVQSDF